MLVVALSRVIGRELLRRRLQPHLVGREHRSNRFVRMLRDRAETMLFAAVWPMLVWFAGWRLVSLADGSTFGDSVGSGLIATSWLYLALALLFQLCRPQGFARRHLDWSQRGLSNLKTMLVMLMAIVLPLMFVKSVLAAQDNVRWQDTLGRLCFMANVLVVALFMQRLLRPSRGVLYSMLSSFGIRWIKRLRWAWYSLGVGIHLGLAAMAAVGYFYTTDRPGKQVRATAVLVVALLMAGSLLTYWARPNSRRRGIRKVAEGRRRKQIATPSADTEIPTIESHGTWFDLQSAGGDIARLISSLLIIVGIVGSWFIWTDDFPVLAIVNQIELWEIDTSISQRVTNSDGSTSVQPIPGRAPVTLGEVLLAVFILLATILASRHLSGLFELPFLERLPVDAALENTIVTATRYVLWIVAVIVGAGMLGFGWSRRADERRGVFARTQKGIALCAKRRRVRTLFRRQDGRRAHTDHQGVAVSQRAATNANSTTLRPTHVCVGTIGEVARRARISVGLGLRGPVAKAVRGSACQNVGPLRQSLGRITNHRRWPSRSK